MELRRRQQREVAVVTGGALNRSAARVSLVILALAVAGLITFGTAQASASHVSCGDTITVDTTLDSDLVDCPDYGIVIDADDITLDRPHRRLARGWTAKAARPWPLRGVEPP